MLHIPSISSYKYGENILHLLLTSPLSQYQETFCKISIICISLICCHEAESALSQRLLSTRIVHLLDLFQPHTQFTHEVSPLKHCIRITKHNLHYFDSESVSQ